MSAVIRVLVCDDERLAADRLSSMLSILDDVEVVGRAQNGAEALSQVAALSPDLLLLDIEMPGWNGFDVVDRLDGATDSDKVPPLVAFVTAFPTFAVDAFDRGALDFLAKPVRRERLDLTLVRARSAIAQRESERRLAEMKDALGALRVQHDRPKTDPDHLWIRHRGELLRLDLDHIDWVRAEGEYVRLFYGNKSYLYRELIGSFDARLDRDRFVRIHRSYIVRRSRIEAIRRSLNGGSMIRIVGGEELPVGRKYAKSTRHCVLGLSKHQGVALLAEDDRSN